MWKHSAVKIAALSAELGKEAGARIPEKIKFFYREAHGSTFVARVIGTFGSKLLGMAVGLVTAVITARALGPEGRGVYAVMLTIGAVGTQIGNVGLPAASTYFVASSPKRLPQLFGANLAVAFGLGTVMAIAILAGGHLFPAISPIESRLLLGLAVAWIPFSLLLLLLQNVLLGMEEIRLYNLLQIAYKVLTGLAIAFVLVAGFTSVRNFFLAGFGILVGAAVFSALAVMRLGSARPRVPPRDFANELLRYGFKAYLATLFSYLVLHFDLLMVASMLGDEAAGYYSISSRMADMVYLLPVALGTILFPKLAGMSEGQWMVTKRVVTYLSVGFLPLLLGAGLLAGPLVRFLFGVEYLPAVLPFLWLLPGVYLLSINTMFMRYFAGIGMPTIAVVSPGIAAAANVLANYFLLPRVGIIGAAVSSTVAYGLMLLASLLYLRTAEKS